MLGAEADAVPVSAIAAPLPTAPLTAASFTAAPLSAAALPPAGPFPAASLPAAPLTAAALPPAGPFPAASLPAAPLTAGAPDAGLPGRLVAAAALASLLALRSVPGHRAQGRGSTGARTPGGEPAVAARRRASSRRELAPGREAGILIRGRSPGPRPGPARPGPGPCHSDV
jgi:hypothetical protein